MPPAHLSMAPQETGIEFATIVAADTARATTKKSESQRDEDRNQWWLTSMIKLFATTGIITYNVLGVIYANTIGDRMKGDKHTDIIREKVQYVPAATTLFLNAITFNLTFLLLVYCADFSEGFRRFAIFYEALPNIVLSISFTVYKFGWKPTFGLSLANITGYYCNLMVVFSAFFSVISVTGIVYVIGLLIEPALPLSLQGTFQQSVVDLEQYLYTQRAVFAGLTLLSIVTIPSHLVGFKIVAEMDGKGRTLSATEAFLEIMYQFGHSGVLFETALPWFAIFLKTGLKIHYIHIVIGVVEMVLASNLILVKGFPLHRMLHQVKPLYSLVHLEHHITKGTYPNSPGTGVWEWTMYGCSIFFCTVFILPIPNIILYFKYFGISFMAHTMFPSKSMISWHVLHHVLLSDIYSATVPGKRDKESSKDYSKYKEKLESESLLARYEWLNDAFGFLLVFGVFAPVASYLGVSFWE